MKLWKWKAVDEYGKARRGLMCCAARDQVLIRLRSRNLFPVRLQAAPLAHWWLRLQARQGKIYWARVARKMSTLLEAGVPILTILEILREREADSFAKEQWQNVYHQVKAGGDLSAGLREFIPAPGPFVHAMIVSGEKSGTLALSLFQIAAQLEEEYAFHQKIRAALFYPGVLLVVALLVLYTLSSVILPMYDRLFQEMNVQMPFFSRLIIIAGKSIPFLLVSMALAVIYYLYKNKGGVSLLLPGTRQIRQKRILFEFCTILSRLLQAGIPLLESLHLLGQIARGREPAGLIDQLRSAVREGKRIAPVLAGSSLFPAEAARMLEVAEESGRFCEMLDYLADTFRQELQEKMEQYPKVLEPFLVVGMAGLVGLVAVGMLLPVFDLTTAIR